MCCCQQMMDSKDVATAVGYLIGLPSRKLFGATLRQYSAAERGNVAFMTPSRMWHKIAEATQCAPVIAGGGSLLLYTPMIYRIATRKRCLFSLSLSPPCVPTPPPFLPFGRPLLSLRPVLSRSSLDPSIPPNSVKLPLHLPASPACLAPRP